MISFIIPAYNAERTIAQCIESVLKQGCEKEILVVDNGSTDKTREIIRRFPVKLLIEEKKGAAAARNKGLREANGNYIAFIDSDVVLPESWTKKALKKLESNEKIAGVGGPGISVEKNIYSEALDSLLFGKDKHVKERYVDSLATMNILYRKRYIKGMAFNTEFESAAGEDPDFNFRLREKGRMLLYSRELSVYHHHPLSLRSLLVKWYNYGRNYPLPYLRHRSMKNIGFYTRIFYVPCLIFFLLLSIVYPIFLYLAILQILSLFLAYAYIGLKVCRGLQMIYFPIIHTLKQLAQLFGISVGVVQRAIKAGKK